MLGSLEMVLLILLLTNSRIASSCYFLMTLLLFIFDLILKAINFRMKEADVRKALGLLHKSDLFHAGSLFLQPTDLRLTFGFLHLSIVSIFCYLPLLLQSLLLTATLFLYALRFSTFTRIFRPNEALFLLRCLVLLSTNLRMEHLINLLHGGRVSLI